MTPRTKTNHSHRVRERTFLGASPTSTSSTNDARLFFFLFSTRASSRETAAGKAASSTVAAESVAPRAAGDSARPGLRDRRRGTNRGGRPHATGKGDVIVHRQHVAFLWVPPLARGAAESRGGGNGSRPCPRLAVLHAEGVNPSSSFTVPTAGPSTRALSRHRGGRRVGERTTVSGSPGGRRVKACEKSCRGKSKRIGATTDVPTAGSSRLSRDSAPANSSGSSSGNISLLLFFRLFMAMTRAAASGAEVVSNPAQQACILTGSDISVWKIVSGPRSAHHVLSSSSSNGTTRLLLDSCSDCPPPSGTPARVGFRGTRRCLAVARTLRPVGLSSPLSARSTVLPWARVRRPPVVMTHVNQNHATRMFDGELRARHPDLSDPSRRHSSRTRSPWRTAGVTCTSW